VLRTSIALLAVVILSGSLASSQAQVPLTDAEDIARVNGFFRACSPDSLKCSLDQWSPSLGFDFRFVTGYAISWRLGRFEGKPDTLISYVQVTPEGTAPTLLASTYPIPEMTPETLRLAGGNLEKMTLRRQHWCRNLSWKRAAPPAIFLLRILPLAGLGFPRCH
jgi:hypothetical protein